MRAAWKVIRDLVESNALHRKGFRLQEATEEFVLQQARDELEELAGAPDDIEELADLFAILIHYAIRKGWEELHLEAAILAKLSERFEVEE